MAEKFYSVSTVAEMLAVNEATVRDWLNNGKLAYSRLGGHTIRIRESALDAFIDDVAAGSLTEASA